MMPGTCDTYREGKLTKTGTPFMGGFSAGRVGDEAGKAAGNAP